MTISYCVPADISRYGIAASAVSGISSQNQQDALNEASARAASYIARRYQMPLTTVGDDVKGAVVKLAVWSMLAVRGASPEASSNYQAMAESAEKWLLALSRGDAELVSSVDSSVPNAEVDEEAYVVQLSKDDEGEDQITAPRVRGW